MGFKFPVPSHHKILGHFRDSIPLGRSRRCEYPRAIGAAPTGNTLYPYHGTRHDRLIIALKEESYTIEGLLTFGYVAYQLSLGQIVSSVRVEAARSLPEPLSQVTWTRNTATRSPLAHDPGGRHVGVSGRRSSVLCKPYPFYDFAELRKIN